MNISDNGFNISNGEDFTTAPTINTDLPINPNESEALIYCILAVLAILCFFSPVFYCILKEMNCRIYDCCNKCFDNIYNYCCCYVDYYNHYREPYCRRIFYRDSVYYDEFWDKYRCRCFCKKQNISENKEVEVEVDISDLFEVVVTQPIEIQEVCSICLGEFGENNNLAKLKCNHKFHEECLSKWIIEHNNNTCPNCRDIIETKM